MDADANIPPRRYLRIQLLRALLKWRRRGNDRPRVVAVNLHIVVSVFYSRCRIITVLLTYPLPLHFDQTDVPLVDDPTVAYLPLPVDAAVPDVLSTMLTVQAINVPQSNRPFPLAVLGLFINGKVNYNCAALLHYFRQKPAVARTFELVFDLISDQRQSASFPIQVHWEEEGKDPTLT